MGCSNYKIVQILDKRRFEYDHVIDGVAMEQFRSKLLNIEDRQQFYIFESMNIRINYGDTVLGLLLF